MNLGRRHVIGAAATLLAAPYARKSARAETVDLHDPSTIVPVTPPAALPPLNFQTLTGGQASLAAYRGQPVVLNFWATWCIPCVAELPELDRLASQGGITVLAVSADRGGAGVVGPFLTRTPITHATVLLDPKNDAAHAVLVVGFPTTLVIDGQGRLRGRLEGPCKWASAGAAVRALTT
jgi:thiol-disulfide isomerase/thioredoxin